MVAIRSATSWRAVRRSASRAKIISICDSCSTDLDRIVSSSGTPLRACSIGIVIEGLDLGARESEGERLDLDAWRRELREHVHRHVSELLDAEEHQRAGRRRDDEAELQARTYDPPQHRRVSPFPWGCSSDSELGADQLGHADRGDLGPRGRTVTQEGRPLLIPVHDDLRPDEDERLRVRVDPLISVRVHPHGRLGTTVSSPRLVTGVVSSPIRPAASSVRVTRAYIGPLDLLHFRRLVADFFLGGHVATAGQEEEKGEGCEHAQYDASIRSSCSTPRDGLDVDGGFRKDDRARRPRCPAVATKPCIRYRAGRTKSTSSVEVRTPPSITIAIGRAISSPADVAHHDQGRECDDRAQGGHHGRKQSLPRASKNELVAEGLGLVTLEVLVMPDHQDDPAGCHAQDRERAHQHPQADRLSEREREEDATRRARPRGRRTPRSRAASS